MKSLLKLIPLLILIYSCDRFNSSSKPGLDFSENNKELKVTGFQWGYGTVEMNKFNGDFDNLDHEIYDLLKGKEGSCRVLLEQVTKDKYGETNSTFNYIGDIDITELNRYQGWEYWHKDGGIRHLIYTNLISPKTNNSAKMDTSIMESAALDTARKLEPMKDTTTAEQSAKIYGFGIDDLHTNELDRASVANDPYMVDGTVTGVSFEHGVFTVRINGGEEISVRFTPDVVSTQTYQKMRLAFQTGNTINSICAKQADGTYALITAEIDEP